MATTFNYYIRPQQRADGSRQVQIRVTHNRKNKYLPTSVYVTKGDLSRDGRHIKNPVVAESVDNRLRAYREAFLKTLFPEYLTIEELLSLLDDIMGNGKKDDDTFHLNIYDYMEKLVKGMEPKTAEGYRTAFNAIRRFAGDKVDINDITSGWVLRFRDFLENEPAVVGANGTTYRRKSRGSRAVSYYLGCLRHVHNAARLEFNDDDMGKMLIPRQPFAKGGVPKMPVTEHRILSIAELRAVMDAPTEPGTRPDMAKDAFLLSFALAGTNTIDLYHLKKTDLKNALLTYNRAKTDSTRRDHARITLKVLPMAADIMARHASDTPWLLDFAERYGNAHEFNRAVNKGLKVVAQLAGLDIPLSSYYARHSWATIARNVCRIDFDTVNAALNHVHHGADRIADIYIARDYSAIWAAQEAVMTEVMNAKKSEKVQFSAAI